MIVQGQLGAQRPRALRPLRQGSPRLVGRILQGRPLLFWLVIYRVLLHGGAAYQSVTHNLGQS